MTRWPACTSRHSYKPLFSIDQANGQHVGPVQHFRNSGKGHFHNCHSADPPSPAPPISDPPPPPNAQFGFNSASICRPGPTISPRGSIKLTNPHGCFLFFFLSAKHSSPLFVQSPFLRDSTLVPKHCLLRGLRKHVLLAKVLCSSTNYNHSLVRRLSIVWIRISSHLVVNWHV